MPLSQEQIAALLKPTPRANAKVDGAKVAPLPRFKHPAFHNIGRITYSETAKECVNSGHWRVNRDNGEPGIAEYVKGNGCRCPTHYKLDGIPCCTVHILMKLNVEMFNDNAQMETGKEVTS